MSRALWSFTDAMVALLGTFVVFPQGRAADETMTAFLEIAGKEANIYNFSILI